MKNNKNGDKINAEELQKLESNNTENVMENQDQQKGARKGKRFVVNDINVKSYNYEDAAKLINVQGVDREYLKRFLVRKGYLTENNRFYYELVEAGIFDEVCTFEKYDDFDPKDEALPDEVVFIREDAITMFRLQINLEAIENDRRYEATGEYDKDVLISRVLFDDEGKPIMFYRSDERNKLSDVF